MYTHQTALLGEAEAKVCKKSHQSHQKSSQLDTLLMYLHLHSLYPSINNNYKEDQDQAFTDLKSF